MKDDELGNVAEGLVADLENPSSAIVVFHAPPMGILDQAPMLDTTFRPIMSGTGDIMHASVGSTAIREVIERFQPALALHGHIHESAGHAKLGRTVCVNPGSEYFAGILRAYVLEIDGDSIKPIRAEA
jgi:Icc-related predicted phosphoesterase